jgi:uncharacterized protein (DUF302 family)
MSESGLITIKCKLSAAETLNRLRSALESAGVTVFAVVDHAASAAAAGLPLRPTTLIIFGNPAAGTPLMQANQLAGIDLPLKVLVWEDQTRAANLSYENPQRLAERRSLGPQIAPQIAAMAKLLDTVTHKAAADL